MKKIIKKMSYDVDAKLVSSVEPAIYADLVKTFKEFDTNKNGVIEKDEFKSLLKELGYEDLTKKQINALFKDREFKGIIEQSGKDHIILSDPSSGKWYLLLMIYVDL